MPICKICDLEAGPWTDEDAYPKWLRKRNREFFHTVPAGDIEPGWEQIPRVLLKPVCQGCQRRLNTAFEVPAHDLLKAMLDGAVLNLSANEQTVLAAWFLKTALVLSLAPPGRQRPVRVQGGQADEIRQRLVTLMEQGVPAEDVSVRAAHIPYRGRSSPSRQPLVPSARPDEHSTLVSGVIYVPGLVAEIVVAEKDDLAPFINQSKHDHRFIRIWPKTLLAKRWPPLYPLRSVDVSALRDAWEHTPESLDEWPQMRPLG